RVAHPRLEFGCFVERIEDSQIHLLYGKWRQRHVNVPQILLHQWNRPYEPAFFFEQAAELGPAKTLDEEFHARLHSRLALSVSVEETQNRDRQLEQFFLGQELCVDVGQVRSAAHSSA